MKTDNIIVVPYNEDWPKEFQKIEAEILRAISKNIIRVEHVGSTSVIGLCSKPIIDIDIVIEDYSEFEQVKSGLESLGYEYEGDLGILDREAFSYNISKKNQLMEHHIYVCPKNSKELKRHITFRNHLRNNKFDCQRYGDIKLEASKKFPTDIEGYLNMKGEIISEIYKHCSLLECENMWNKFRKLFPVSSTYKKWSFGCDTDILANLVILGKKTATSSLYMLYKIEKEELPYVGDLNMILFKNGDPACITRTIKVTIVPFKEVDDVIAFKEGEGDKTLEFWQKVHRQFFEEELAKLGMTFNEEVLVVCEEFEVLYS